MGSVVTQWQNGGLAAQPLLGVGATRLGQMGGSGMVEGQRSEAMVEGRDSEALLVDHHTDIDRAEATTTSPRR
jgi:hypothetical protein